MTLPDLDLRVVTLEAQVLHLTNRTAWLTQRLNELLAALNQIKPQGSAGD